mmetsp:Transcript_45486/g.75549  ORF Transcript_45486/g.75549 Transcript_45486/m.75549 type:complete len:211 (+) Transcript_45486:222-854(+)
MLINFHIVCSHAICIHIILVIPMMARRYLRLRLGLRQRLPTTKIISIVRHWLRLLLRMMMLLRWLLRLLRCLFIALRREKILIAMIATHILLLLECLFQLAHMLSQLGVVQFHIVDLKLQRMHLTTQLLHHRQHFLDIARRRILRTAVLRIAGVAGALWWGWRRQILARLRACVRLLLRRRRLWLTATVISIIHHIAVKRNTAAIVAHVA